MTLRTLIADDEPLAQRRLVIALNKLDDIDLVGTADDGEQALEAIAALKPDLLLLDVMMPGMNGFELLKALEVEDPPAVIFVTAFDNYAVDAFNEGALDYVLKPVDETRLCKAIDRARDRRRTLKAEARVEQLRDVVARLDQARADDLQSPYDQDLWINSRGSVVRVPVKDVRCFRAAGDYVSVQTGTAKHLADDTITSLDDRLDPDKFLRVHRSSIVNLSSVRAIEREKFGAVVLVLDDDTRIRVSKSYKKQTLQRLTHKGSAA